MDGVIFSFMFTLILIFYAVLIEYEGFNLQIHVNLHSGLFGKVIVQV